MIQGRKKASSTGFYVRFSVAMAVYLCLFTDVLDAWVVPFADQPYSVYRADFLRDVSEYTGISARGSAKAAGSGINFSGWVGRR